jgi:multidrug efflux pump subunit AcrA (membrane-fusion protein)
LIQSCWSDALNSGRSQRRVLTLADLATLKARFNVPDFALAGFRQGQCLDLSIDAFSAAGVHGRVLSLAAAADPKARSFQIVVPVPNQD